MVKVVECPCCSGKSYSQCCAIYHQGEKPKTAKQLMRSRYSAFAMGLADYLKQTWHPNTYPKNIHLGDKTKWLRLKIVATKEISADEASVHFIATYKENGKAEKMEENSLFKKVDGVWLYLNAQSQI